MKINYKVILYVDMKALPGSVNNDTRRGCSCACHSHRHISQTLEFSWMTGYETRNKRLKRQSVTPTHAESDAKRRKQLKTIKSGHVR